MVVCVVVMRGRSGGGGHNFISFVILNLHCAVTHKTWFFSGWVMTVEISRRSRKA